MTRILAIALSVFAVLLLVHQAPAQMYKWVDQDGVVHFSDTPPATEEELETIETPNYPPPAPGNTYQQPSPYAQPSGLQTAPDKPDYDNSPKARQANDVTIYTTDWCRYCKQATAFLRSEGIAFKEYDIEKNEQAADRMESLGGDGSVPFAVINGKIIVGFSPGAYRQALGLN